jgi:hypothetical protein
MFTTAHASVSRRAGQPVTRRSIVKVTLLAGDLTSSTSGLSRRSRRWKDAWLFIPEQRYRLVRRV